MKPATVRNRLIFVAAALALITPVVTMDLVGAALALIGITLNLK